MALCGRMAYGSWFDEPERWGRLPSSEQCGHCRAALRRMGGVDGYMREALEARRAADEAEIAELTTLLDEVRSFARRVPVIRQLPARLDPVQLGGLLKSLHLGGCRSARKTQSQAERTDSAAVRARP